MDSAQRRFSADVAAVLRVGGRVPRRAVLLGDGGLAERVEHPSRPEAELVSRLCELARQAAGQAVWPRRTADLLELALTTNAPGAWSSLRDDVVTADLDMDAAAAVLRQGSNASALVSCLVGSRDANHMLHIGVVLSRVLDGLSEESRLDVGRALACQLRAVMDVFAAHGALMSRDVRDVVMHGFGRMVALAGVPDAHVADLVLYALAQRRDELLRLFLHLPATFVAHKPQVLVDLLDRARTAPPHNRYPPLALLTRVVVADPDIVAGFERDVLGIVAGVLPEGPLDARTCLAAATLAVATLDGREVDLGRRPGEGGGGVEVALARALQSCSAEIVRRAVAG